MSLGANITEPDTLIFVDASSGNILMKDTVRHPYAYNPQYFMVG